MNKSFKNVDDTDEDLTAQPTSKSLEKRKGAYQRLRRDLSEDDLNNSGTQKLLLNDLDRLEDKVQSLAKYRDLFHETDKEKAVLKERLNHSLSSEVLYTVSISLGATLIGLSNSVWSEENNTGLLILLCGIILVLGGVISKFFWK